MEMIRIIAQWKIDFKRVYKSLIIYLENARRGWRSGVFGEGELIKFKG